MDTLYTLCRSIDRRHVLPLSPTAAHDVAACKREYLLNEAKSNPLLHEVLCGGTVTFHRIETADRHGFLQGPATLFRTHEILRKTRASNTPIRIGDQEHSHAQVVDWFARCVPNVRLHHVPWWSLSSYRTSLALAWSATLLTAYFVGRDGESPTLLDSAVLFYMGVLTTIVALVHVSLSKNRDFRHAAPWNSAMYLDVNIDQFRRNAPGLAWARKELVPQQRPFKSRDFYYALARSIEHQQFDRVLEPHLLRTSTVGATHPQ